MREANYKIGWVIPNQVLGLTHVNGDIQPEDIHEGLQQVSQLINETDCFQVSIIIDNKLVQKKFHVPFSNSSSSFNSSKVNWLVAVKPEEIIKKEVPQLAQNGIKLKSTAGIREALKFLNDTEQDYAWADLNVDFFPPRI